MHSNQMYMSPDPETWSPQHRRCKPHCSLKSGVHIIMDVILIMYLYSEV
jgi:hypothetical protein